MPSVSLCMIVKDEEELLPRAVNSFSGCYDQLVVVDTGSTDKTVQVAEGLGAEVYHYPWNDDFGMARNFAFSRGTCEWRMCLDADDVFSSTPAEFNESLDAVGSGVNVCRISVRFLDHLGNVTLQYPSPRLGRNGKAQWHHPIHEYLAPTEGFQHDLLNLKINHLRPLTRTGGTERNVRILKKEIAKIGPERARTLFYLSREVGWLGKHDEAVKYLEQYFEEPTAWPVEKHRAYVEYHSHLKSLGRTEEAKMALFKAISLDYRYPEPWVHLAWMEYERKAWDSCYFYATTALRLPKQDTYVFDEVTIRTTALWHVLSIACWHLGKINEGIYYAKLASEQNPGDQHYLSNLKWFEDKVAQNGTS